MKKTIEISNEVYALLETESKFGESPNDVIARLLSNKLSLQQINISNNQHQKTSKLISKGVAFWEGMKLRAVYKGREHLASVLNGKIVYANQGHQTPSSAAMAITNSPVNGWKFWEYLDETNNRWYSINDLRKS